MNSIEYNDEHHLKGARRKFVILLSHMTTLVAKIIDCIDQNIATAIIIIGCRKKCRRKTINSDNIVGTIKYLLWWISMT